MTIELRRLLSLNLVLFALLAAAYAVAENDAGNRNEDAVSAVSHDHAVHPLSALREQAVDFSAQKVEEALKILRPLEIPARLKVEPKKSSRFLANITSLGAQIFNILFMNGPSQRESQASQLRHSGSHSSLTDAVELLEDAAKHKNSDAIYLLAEMNFHGNFSNPINYSRAFEWYDELAAVDGNSSAQHMLGFMYATGVGGLEQNQAKALLYHTFAAEAGNLRSQMTVAYRHHIGIGTSRNCEEAVYHYKNVAEKAIEYMRSGPPGGYVMFRDSYNIADENGGIFGEGASVSSSGSNAKQGGPHTDTHAAFDDVMDYLDLASRKGDLTVTFSLGKLHYEGSRSLKRDYHEAKKYFLDVARTYWSRDGKVKPDAPPRSAKLAPKAAGYLGQMFLRGEGMAQSFTIAQTWFKRGIASGDALSQYYMGIMYLNGLEVPHDPVKAAELFSAAADQDFAAAQVRLGVLFLDQGDVATANQYFNLAAQSGQIEAYYYLAELAKQGVGRDQSCNVAAIYYKIVAEKAETILVPFKEANTAYEGDHLETALVNYMMAAEQGFETGQANVAFLLDHARPKFSLQSLWPFAKKKASLLGDAALALIYWTRSAKQSNIDSMVRMGDYYLSGLGTIADSEKAAACYQAAAETLLSAQAMWNLGWMHENGVGIEQDFHLAKRFYDWALETNPHEAYLPVSLALYKLRLRSWWNSVTNGKIKSIQDDPEPKKEWSFSEWFANILEPAPDDYDYYEPDDYDTPQDNSRGGDEFFDDIDGEVLETLGIIALTALLAFLVFYRQQQVNNRRAQEQQQQGNAPGAGGVNGQQAQGERGLFPAPDDPEFLNWAAGGVGH